MSRNQDALRSVAGASYIDQVTASIRRILRPSSLPAGWTPVQDEQLFWFIQTRHDAPLLQRTLADLRRLYPVAAVLVVSDGDDDPALPALARDQRAAFLLRDGVMRVEQGGRPVHDMLEAFLQHGGDVLIKIDPDTHIRRRLTRLPPADRVAIYGTVQSAGAPAAGLTSVQGGCIIVPRAAAMRLVASRILLSDRLRPTALEWAVAPQLRARADAGLTSHDWTLGWGCRETDVTLDEHPEVFASHRPSLMDTLAARRMAIAHPRLTRRDLFTADFYVRGLRAAWRRARGRE